MPNNKPSRVSVAEKTKQFESLSNIEEDAGTSESQEAGNESEDDGIDFAELVRNISGENHAGSGEGRNEALREAFKILDYDEDGFISISDMINALKLFDEDDDESSDQNEGVEDDNEELAKDMIEEGDYDGDGKISFEDFIKVLQDDDRAAPQHSADDTKDKKKRKKKKSHK